MAREIWRGTVSEIIMLLTADAPSNLTAPTQLELGDANAIDLKGTNQAEALFDVTGFAVNSQSITGPDAADFLEIQVPGPQQFADSSMTFYKDDTTTPIETALTNGVTGHIYFLSSGKGSGKHFEGFAVTCMNPTYPKPVAANEQAKFVVPFAITAYHGVGAQAA